MLLHFALVLHFAAILITFCVNITFCGDYYILRRNKPETQVSLSRKMKENAIKLLGKVVLMRSSPSGKRSENAGIR